MKKISKARTADDAAVAAVSTACCTAAATDTVTISDTDLDLGTDTVTDTVSATVTDTEGRFGCIFLIWLVWLIFYYARSTSIIISRHLLQIKLFVRSVPQNY